MKGKELSIIIIIASIFTHAGIALAYHKYRYLDYDYMLVDENKTQFIERLMNGKAPFNSMHADYAFLDKEGSLYSCVLLSRADRRHLRKQLNLYVPSTIITDDLIALFSPSSAGNRRMKPKIVGWVLRDFKHAHEGATVGQVLYALGIESESPLLPTQ